MYRRCRTIAETIFHQQSGLPGHRLETPETIYKDE